MDISQLTLTAAALLPAVVLCVYIYGKDSADKEPMGLLLRLLLGGAVAAVPIIVVELLLGQVLTRTFLPYATIINGVPVLQGKALYASIAAENWIGVALVEEGFKLLTLSRITRRSRHFNSLFDGVIYAVFVSLGFAALENVLYVLNNGWTTALMRAVMSVPGHCFFGVFMGLYYTQWHLFRKASEAELRLAREGRIRLRRPLFSASAQRYAVMSLLAPVLIHGFYDFCLSIDSSISFAVFLIFLVLLYRYAFRTVGYLSRLDRMDRVLVNGLLAQKYPGMSGEYPASR